MSEDFQPDHLVSHPPVGHHLLSSQGSLPTHLLQPPPHRVPAREFPARLRPLPAPLRPYHLRVRRPPPLQVGLSHLPPHLLPPLHLRRRLHSRLRLHCPGPLLQQGHQRRAQGLEAVDGHFPLNFPRFLRLQHRRCCILRVMVFFCPQLWHLFKYPTVDMVGRVHHRIPVHVDHLATG